MPASRFARLLRGAGLGALAVPIAAALLLAGPAIPAHASLGSVPLVVSDYVGGGPLQARLEQLYGPGKKGSGVDFDATTKPGAISRVWEWTDDRYTHPASEHPIQLTNYWTVPITIAAKPVGVAAVWINPRSDQPELAEFTSSPALATALGNVPADAALVHDASSAAWFAVAGTTANPLVSGRSGVTTATPIAELPLTKPGAAPPVSGDPNTGVGLAIGVLALLVIVIVVALVLPARLRKTGVAVKAEAAGSEPEPEPESEPELEPESDPEKSPAPKATAKPRSTTAGKSRTAAVKPASTPKPSDAQKPAPAPKRASARPRSPVSQKPATSKPSGTKPTSTKPAASKPPASKPPASTPPAGRPRPQKPTEDGDPAA